MNRDELPRPDTSMIKEWFATLLNHEYRVYHHNSEARVVATTMGYAVTPAQAIEAAMAYAVNWNFNETRDNMTVTYLECEGVEVQVTSESPTTSSEIYGPGGYEDRGTR